MTTVIRSAIVLMLLCQLASCGASSEPTQTISFKGGVRVQAITQPSDSLGDSMNIIAISSSGKRYTQRPKIDGSWSFTGMPVEDYSVYATRPRFGRSADQWIDHTNISDTTILRLGEQPTVRPMLDSIVGSSTSGFMIYVTVKPQDFFPVALLIRDAGAGDSAFTVWGDRSDVVFDTSRGQYIAWAAKDPKLAAKEVAAVEYNLFGDTYDQHIYKYRFCSQGPISNTILLK